MQARKLDYQGFKPSGGLQNVGSLLVSPARRATLAKMEDSSNRNPLNNDTAYNTNNSLQAFQQQFLQNQKRSSIAPAPRRTSILEAQGLDNRLTVVETNLSNPPIAAKKETSVFAKRASLKKHGTADYSNGIPGKSTTRNELGPIEEDHDDDCLTAFQKYGKLRFEQRQTYLKTTADEAIEEAALSLGSSVFSKSDDGEDDDKKGTDDYFKSSIRKSSLAQSENKTAMIDKLLLDMQSVKDSVVPPTVSVFNVDSPAKYDVLSKKSVSIASDSSSSGLSELSENAILEKAKAKQNGDQSKMKNSDDEGSQDGKEQQFVSLIAGLTAKTKPILTTEEKVEALQNGLQFEIINRDVLAKQTAAKNEAKTAFAKWYNPVKQGAILNAPGQPPIDQFFILKTEYLTEYGELNCPKKVKIQGSDREFIDVVTKIPKSTMDGHSPLAIANFHKFKFGSQLSNPCIAVPCYYATLVPDSEYEQTIEHHILYEYYGGIGLDRRIRHNGQIFYFLDHIKDLGLQLISLIRLLHHNRTICPNLYPGNIVYNQNGQGVRLVDLGLEISVQDLLTKRDGDVSRLQGAGAASKKLGDISRALEQLIPNTNMAKQDSLSFMFEPEKPELTKQELRKWKSYAPEQIDGERSLKTDIWQFGCVLLEFCTATQPYDNCENGISIAENLTSARISPLDYAQTNFSDKCFIFNQNENKELLDLMVSCFQFNQDLRPTAEDIYRSKFFQDYKKEKHNKNKK